MNIQSSINQGVSLASLLISQSPAAASRREAKVEAKQAEAEQKQARKDIETYEKMADYGIDPTTEAEAAVQLAIAEKGQAAYGKAFELDPTTKSYKMYQATVEDVAYLKQEVSRLGRQRMAARSAADAGAAEAERLAASNMLDLSKLDERTIARVNRAYKRAERDTYYLNKNNPKGGNQ